MKEKTNEIVRKQLSDRGICVLIPTFNNATTVEGVVRQSLSFCNDVIVVNDGSTDNTANILKSIDGITLIEYEKNRGKGYALKTGFRYAKENAFAYVITIDADGQHNPNDITRFLEANREYPGALIVGRRNMKGVERSKGSTFANHFSNFWFALQTGRLLKDTQTGYRLYPVKKLHGLSLMTSRYEAELQVLVFSAWHGIKIRELSVDVYYPPKEQRVSHFRPAIDFGRISLLNTLLCVLAVVYGLPRAILRFVEKICRNLYVLITFLFFSLFVVNPAVWIYTKMGKMTEHKKLNLHKLIQWLAKFIIVKHGVPGAKFKYKVHEDVDFEKPHVIICNHQSHFDLMCQLIFSPKIIFLTKNWVYRNPFYGFLIRHADFLPVKEGIEELMPKLKELSEKGYSIAVYPEGTRSETCEIARFHQGAFYIAKQLDIDILPMCLYGTGKVMPKKKHHINRWPMFIEVDSPISREKLKEMGGTLRQASCLREYYKQKYRSIADKIEQDV